MPLNLLLNKYGNIKDIQMKRLFLLCFFIYSLHVINAQTYSYSINQVKIQNNSLFQALDTIISFQNFYCRSKYNIFIMRIYKIDSINYLFVESEQSNYSIFSLKPIGVFYYKNYSFFVIGKIDENFLILKNKIEFVFNKPVSFECQMPIIDEIVNSWTFQYIDGLYNLKHINSLCIEMPDSLFNKENWEFLEEYYKKVEENE